MSYMDRKRRGNMHSKYITRSNLHVINPQLPEPPISLKKSKVKQKVIENTVLSSENNQSALKNSSLCQVNKIASVKKDKVTTDKESNSTKSVPIQQKKDASNKNQKSHPLSNFLALSQNVPTRQEKEVRNFKSNFLALQQGDKNAVKSKPASSKIVDYISSEGTVNKILNLSTSRLVCRSTVSVKTNKLAVDDVKKKPDQAKKSGPPQKLGGPSCMPQHIQSKSTVKKKLIFDELHSLQQLKELSHHESEFSTRKQGDKLKAIPGSSKKYESPNKRDAASFKNKYESYEKETELRKGARSPRAYLSRDLEDKEKYYRSKYEKSKDKQRDYKWHERKKYPENDHYDWYNKEYDLTKKYHEVSHSSKKYSDFEELEDYEEVASIEDGSKDSKVPVRFRKCMVRYLPYTIYSYFRPKWHYLSRKRYVVNCLYASGREVKRDRSKLKVAKSDLEVPEEDFKSDDEILDVAPDNEEMMEDVSEDNGNTTEDVSVHDNEETIENVSVQESEETINDVSVHDNQETTGDDAVVHDSEETTGDGAVVHNINEEVTEDLCIVHEVNIKQDEVLKVDLKPMESKKKIQNKNKDNLIEKNLTKVASSPEKVQSTQNTKTSMTPKKKVTDLQPDKPLKSNDVVKNMFASSAITGEALIKDDKSIIKKKEIEIINLDDGSDLENSETYLYQTDQKEQSNSKEPADKSPRVFLQCISSLNFTPDFHQGDVAIQSSLSEWKSHLIGLEYVLEIQDNTDGTIIKKYHCGLCNEDLPSPGQIVINHIISYDHMCNYVAKHFPSSDYKFSKSARSRINEIVLQTCCEEINHNLGYHYMCSVKEDYFKNEYGKIKEHFNAMKHWDESNMTIYPKIIIDELESDIHKDVKCIVEDMMNKIMAGEPKKTFFTPQTIVSSLRHANVKDKKKDLLKINENIVNRSLQKTLIVLTPSSSVTAVKTPSLPSVELKSPKKLITSPPMPKTSKDSHRVFNLLQVPVHDTSQQHLKTDTQFSATGGGCGIDNNATINTSDKMTLPQINPPCEEENLSAEAINNPNLSVSDIESTFSFGAKKAGSFRKYRFQDSAPVPPPATEPSEKESAVRIVRIKTSRSRPIPLGSDTDEEDQGESVDRSAHLKEDAAIAENVSSNEDNDNTVAADNLQGEDISDEDFSELDFVEVVSAGHPRSTPRSRSYKRQQHWKAAIHSKYCHKRASKASSSDKESLLKDINLSGSLIPTIGKTTKKYSSNFMKKSDEYSQDSYASSASKRKRSPRSSSSPSLEEFLRKLSPSPVRMRSKSPLRPYSTYKKHGTMIRRHSRSPYRRYSRSPNSKHSRSPYRKRSRSPIRRRSSPYRKRSRSPNRKRSRSPNRKRSRSPNRKRSRTPIRKRSRSPIRRHSRSPYRRPSRSPRRRSSRSPIRRSRSPLWSVSKEQSKRKSSPFRKVGGYRVSRSPEKAPIKLPSHKYSKSPPRRPMSPLSTYTRPKSPIRSDSRMPEDTLRYKSESLYKHSKDSIRSSGSFESTSKLTLPHRRPETELIKDDLEDISDEDESKYFNTPETPKYMEIIKNLPESARIMLVKVLQRFSITNINPNDPSFYELMKFVASHSSEIQRLMSQPSVLPEMSTPVQGNPTGQSQESFLHQYILTGMKGNLSLPSEAIPSTSSAFPGPAGINFQQTLGPSTSGLQFHSNLPPNQFAQSVFQQPSAHPLYPVQSIHTTPPNVPSQQVFMKNAPPTQQQQQSHFQPDVYRPVSPPKQAIPRRPKVTSEVMFKDLKATVSKIFGGDDALAKLGIKIPGLGGISANEKYSPNPSNVPQINLKPQTSYHGNQSGQINPEPQTSFHGKVSGLDNEAPTRINDNLMKSYPKEDEAYFNKVPRQGLHVPHPDAKVSFCDVQRPSSQRNLFPVVNSPERTPNYRQENSQISVNEAKKSLAQRLAAVLVKVGMTDVPAHLLQEMLMKIGAFSLNPPQDISEGEILGILRKLKYL